MPRANKGALVWLGQGLGVAVAVLAELREDAYNPGSPNCNLPSPSCCWGRGKTSRVMKVIDGHRWDLLKPLLSATLMHHSHIQTVLALHLAAVQQTGWSQ